MSAPAANEFGFGRLPSGGAFGADPVMMMTRTESSASAQELADFNAEFTSALSEFNLSGR